MTPATHRNGTLWLALAAAAVVLALPAAAQASDNLVYNASFEEGGCGNTPVLCGWAAGDSNTSMSQDTTNPHTGSASVNVSCPYPACDLWLGGLASISSDPSHCAPIGPGAHQASFWYRDAAGGLTMEAQFFTRPDCTGPSTSAFFGASEVSGGWQQAVGALAAPPGTQSALFSLKVIGGCVGACDHDGPCYCGIGANFDDVEVDSVGDTAPPAISSFSPTSGPNGTTLVDITGTHFTGAGTVTFNGTPAYDQEWSVTSSTEILAFVPPGATSGPISITTPFGTGTSSDPFTVTAPPPILCCSEPTSGPVGTTVDLMGGNFTGATSVAFNGTPDPSFVVNSPNDITAHVPAGATTGPISVTTPGGTDTTGGPFTVTTSAPAITSFTPTSGPVGTPVDIQGANFNAATSVKFSGTADPSFVVNSSTDITTHVPSGATSGPISVTTPGGTATSAGSFTVLLPPPPPPPPPSPPRITGISPTSGHAGQQVTITGSNFGGAMSVALGTAFASFVLSSSTTITATVPNIARGYYRWSVTTLSGTTTSTRYFRVR